MKKLLVLFSILTCNSLIAQEYIPECALYGKIKCDSLNNSIAKFKSGDDDVCKYLFKKLPELKKIGHEHSVDLSINENGKITKAIVLDNGRASCSKHMKDIETCLLNMPKWSSAKRDSKPIAVSNHVINFSSGPKYKESTEIITPPSENTVYEMPEKPEVYFIVDTRPEFPGGHEKLVQYLNEDSKDFIDCKKDSAFKPCNIFFQVIIDKAGKCMYDRLLKSQCTNCSDVESRIKTTVAKMPLWKPGSHEGEIVKVRCNMIITLK